MYNRYIPQSDGSYSRNRIPDAQDRPIRRPSAQNRPPQRHEPERYEPERHEPERCEPEKQEPECCESRPCDQPLPCPKDDRPHPHKEQPLSFLRRLLPKDFDTGDLIVILLLLLLAGDCEEDRSTALLTLAFYLFM